MEDILIGILEGLTTPAGTYPVFRQGSLTEEQPYPETFFTFWNNLSEDHAHYDNAEYGTRWEFDVNVYSVDPVQTYDLLDAARAALKSEGWIISGRGYDVPTDEPTHTGRGMSVLYLET